jgi:hypothetical protein
MTEPKKRRTPSEFPSAGARMLAALVSYVRGASGVDSTLKMLKGREVAPEWDDLATKLLADLMHSLDEPKKPKEKKKITIPEEALKKPPLIQ